MTEGWSSKFHGGDENIEDDQCSDRPSSIDNDPLSVLVNQNQRTTVY